MPDDLTLDDFFAYCAQHADEELGGLERDYNPISTWLEDALGYQVVQIRWSNVVEGINVSQDPDNLDVDVEIEQITLGFRPFDIMLQLEVNEKTGDNGEYTGADVLRAFKQQALLLTPRKPLRELTATFDEEAGATYIRFSTSLARTKMVQVQPIFTAIDYDDDGTVIGVELIAVELMRKEA